MPIRSAEELRARSESSRVQWNQYSAERNGNPSPLTEEPTIELHLLYGRAAREFVLQLSVRATSPVMSFAVSTSTIFEYGEELEVNHEDILQFIEVYAGPLSFTLLNSALAELGGRFSETYPQVIKAEQDNFWAELRLMPEDELLFELSGSRVE